MPGLGSSSVSGPSATAFGSAAGDPFNLATGEEDYRPGPNMVVYNPIGPSVTWQRVYESMGEQIGNGFGPDWSDSYNIFINYSSTSQVSTATSSMLTLPNFGGISFTHPVLASGPTSGSPIQCGVAAGAPYAVE